MTRIVKFMEFLNEADEVKKPAFERPPAVVHNPNDEFYLHTSDKLKEIIYELKKDDYTVASLLYRLTQGYYYKYLLADPVNYLNLEDDGTISFLKSRYFTEQDKWGSSRREKTKATKILRLLYNEDYLKNNIKETDIEAFSNKLSAMKDEKFEVLEFRGDEILRAYNYKVELSKNFGMSCANFKQKDGRFGGYDEPTTAQFDIYTKNPENCGAAVVMGNDGVIVARRSFQQGPQVFDNGGRKAGQVYTVWGNYYGVGGGGSKYDTLIKGYLTKKYNAVCKATGNGAFIISMETRFEYYCPFDSMWVSFKDNLLSDSNARLPDGKYPNWTNTYHAACPYDLVAQRLEEEKAVKTKVVQPVVQPTQPVDTRWFQEDDHMNRVNPLRLLKARLKKYRENI